MSKKMLINATLPEEDRVAIVEDGILTELDIETAGHQQTKGNIYKGEVIRVEQGLQAAFIDYGAQRPGFLQIGEIHPSLYPKRDDEGQSNRRPPITEILKRGQQILVQVVKEERGTKGAALTTEVSLPGRYMVLIPQSSSRGISRKIDNDHVRKEIKHTLSSLELPDNMGYIIRTAAIDQPPEELKRDFDYLLNTYNSIVSHSEKAKAPALIYQESNLVLRSIRDYFSPEIDEVLIDDREVFQQARDFFKAVMPDYVQLVKLHQERRPIFARYQIEEQISHLSSNTVNLPSGGSIVLDQTEALVAIDVNSGKMGGEQDVEATAHRVNLEAAVEVARQLRLRDMGGLIVIDFIDMRQRRNAREVEKALKTALKIDKARVTVGRISHQFGLLEMSRQRIKANLGEGSYNLCPHCQGSGRIRSDESRSIALLRRIQAGTAKGHIEAVICTAALDTANYLLNNKRRELYDLEQRYKLTIEIKGDSGYLPEQIDIDFVKQSRDQRQENRTDQGPLVDTDLSERANIEVVLPETSTTEQGDQENSQKDEKSEETPRKSPRRRRRSNRRRSDRNKRSEETNGEVAAEAAPVTTDQDQDQAKPDQTQTPQQTEPPSQPEQASEAQKDSGSEAQPATPVKTQEDAAQSADATEETDKAQTPRKPARRRPARRKAPAKEPEQTDQDPSAVKTVVETAQQEGSADSERVESDSQTETKPKRRAPRRKPAATSDSPTETVVDSETPKVTEETKPAPRRRRTTRKTTASDTTATSENTTEASPENTEDSKKKAAPAKRTTRRKTTAKTTAEPESAAADTTQAQTGSDAETPEKKPVRRRRTATKKATEKAVDSPTATPAETTTEGAEEPPKKKTTRRRTTTTKKNATSTENAAEAAEATEKKPTRRRTTRKTTTEKATEEETPKKTTRSKKSTEKAAEDGEEKPKRRAPRKKKAEPAPETDA